ncbi:hypothetical protein KFE25_004219 [Diacronema lutheri]|uniref:Uncharacterized protein n=1 Tax=Diacronema lutheri TaxID=2081491 RepID=A0A8J6C6B3_DIALT|nr:hypothetical protein KFE25_004219 [Diacronema lutheri]
MAARPEWVAAPVEKGAAQPTAPGVLCRRCTHFFDAKHRAADGCQFHPESWSGETKQRWAAPGENDGASDVHYFWSCCGASERDAPGCKRAAHCTFDEEDTLTW